MNDRQIALSELNSLTGGNDDIAVVETVRRAREIIKAAKICTMATEAVNTAQRELDEAKRRADLANQRFGELIATAK